VQAVLAFHSVITAGRVLISGQAHVTRAATEADVGVAHRRQSAFAFSAELVQSTDAALNTAETTGIVTIAGHAYIHLKAAAANFIATGIGSLISAIRTVFNTVTVADRRPHSHLVKLYNESTGAIKRQDI